MRKKLTFLLVALFVSMFAMADITYYPDLSVGGVKVDCWVDDDGIVYKFDSETETVEGYCYNTEANDNGAPVFDTTKEFDLVFLDYIDGYPVTSIGNGVNRSFYNLTNLISLTIPEKVTFIGSQAFYGCTNLATIYCFAETPPTLGTSSAGNSFGMNANSIPLGNSTDKVKVYIPYGTTSSYKANSTSTSPRTWGWYEAQGYFEFIEMEEGAQGPTTEGVMTVVPTTGTRLSGSFESITLSYEGGVTLYNEEAFPIYIYSTDNASTAVASLMYDESTSAQDDGSYILYVYDAEGTTKQTLTSYGDYTFTIPELIFYLGGEDSDLGNQKLIINYTIEDATEYTIALNPENNTETTETISTFTVTCSSGLSLLIEPGQFGTGLITIYKDGAATDNYLLHVVGEDEETVKNSYKFTFNEALSSKGKYTFTLPAGMFKVGPNNQLSKDTLITYTLTANAEEYSEIVWEPNGESILSELKEIYLYNYIDEDGTRATSRIKFAEDGESQVTITDEGNQSYSFTTETNTTRTYIKFILNEAITDGGYYTVTIPAGAVLLGQNETANTEVILNTYQVASYDIYFDPADDSSVDKIETFTVKCDDGLVPKLNDDEVYDNIDISTVVGGIPQITNYYAVLDENGQIYDETDLTKQIGQTYTIYQKTTDEDGNETTAEATITEPGTYQFEIGKGLFALGEEEVSNGATTCTYKINTFELTIGETVTVAEDYSSITATITAEEGIDIAIAEDNTEKIRVVKGASELVAYATAEQGTDGAWTFTFISTEDVEEGSEPEEIKLATTGDYTLTIPEGFFTDTNNPGSKSEKLDIKFSIVISFEPTIEKEEVSSDGSSVEITFSEGVTLVDDTTDLDPITITTLNENNEPVIVAYAVATFSSGILTLSFVDEEGVEVDLEPGEYTLTIPEGYFTDAAGDVSEEIIDTITITESGEPDSGDGALFSTHFTDWYSLAEEDAQDKVIPVTTATGGNFTFTLNGVSVNPGDVSQYETDDEGNKTPKFEAEGALIFGKASAETDVYYVETSALGSVDEISFTEAATAKNRGVKVLVKGAEDTDWVTLYDTSLSDYSADVVIDEINRTGCQIRFENLVYNQNAYILDLKIYGTDGEELTFDTALEIDPASGEELESLESFTISYADGIELDNSTLQGYVVNEKGANKAIFDFTKTSDTKGVQTGYTFTLYDISDPETPAALTADGTYTISIAEGAFRLGIYDESIVNDDKETTEQIDITYVIGTGISAKTEDFVLTPENGATELTELSEFTASCEMGITLTKEDIALDVTVGNTVVAIAKYVEGDETEDTDGTISSYTIKFYDPETGDAIALTEEATYSFTIPEGTFTYGTAQNKNEEIVIYYTIGELWFTFVPSDGSTVSSLESVSVTNGLEGVGVRYLPYPEDPRETPTGLIVVLDEKKDTVATVPNYDDYVVDIWDERYPDEPDTEVIFNFDRPIKTAGTYTVVIPKNIIFQGKRDIDSTGDIELTITVDGTEDDDTYKLYIELDDGALGDNSSLEEVWATIQKDYSESVEALQATYDEISAEIYTLRLDLLSSYKAGNIVEDATEFKAQITEIQTKINALLATASGIDGITTDAMSFEGKGVYTISGQKVSNPTKAGIYIIDGKKVVIK